MEPTAPDVESPTTATPAPETAPATNAPIRRAPQRAAGRLRVGAVDDAAEREADAVAQAVVRRQAARAGGGAAATTPAPAPLIRRAPEGGTVIRRLWGFGNAGRTEKEEERIVADARSTPDEAVAALRVLLRKKRTDIDHFNEAMRLLHRPDVKSAVAPAYSTSTGGTSLPDAIRGSFSGFRADYLCNVVDHDGTADGIHRVRLALGTGSAAAGPAKQQLASSQGEVMELFAGLSAADQLTLFTVHGTEMKRGLSGKAYAQLQAMMSARTYAGGSPPAGGVLDSVAAKGLLAAQDRELSKIVLRARKGESTAAYDALAVKVTVNRDQLMSEVKAWVARAKELERDRFGGAPTIRQHVLGATVQVGSADVDNTQKAFVTAMSRWQIKGGWNDGDRLMVRMLVASGAAVPAPAAAGAPAPPASSAPAAPGGAPAPPTSSPARSGGAPAPPTSSPARSGGAGAPASAAPAPTAPNGPAASAFAADQVLGDITNAHIVRLQAAVAATSDEKAIEALAALAAEIQIQNTRGARNRVDRVIAAFAALDDPAIDAICAAFGTTRKLIYTELQPMLKAAEVRRKERSRIGATLDPDLASPAIVELARYSGKGVHNYWGRKHFKPAKAAQRIAALSPEERVAVAADGRLMQQLEAMFAHSGASALWTTVAKLLPRPPQAAAAAGGAAPAPGGAPAGSGSAPPPPGGPAATPAPGPAAVPAAASAPGGAPAAAVPTAAPVSPHPDAASWAERWALMITNSTSEKKIYTFALDILDAAPDGAGLLADVATAMKGSSDDVQKAAWAQLSKYGLGQALASGKAVGAEYDIVGKIIKKAGSVRLGGSADVDAICGTFENLSGAALLDQWTNIATFDDTLTKRKGAFERLDIAIGEWMTASTSADPADQQRAEHAKKLVPPILAEIGTFNAELAPRFRLTMRADRRAKLNEGRRQLKTPEFQEVSKRLANHLATKLREDATVQALVDRGVLPSELQVAGEVVLFVADQSKQRNLDTWVQWAAFTSKGQLRVESGAVLTRQLRHLGGAVAGGDAEKISEARTQFAETRAELNRRTASFVKTVTKYKDRLKRLIALILDVVIIASTMGIGAVPVLIGTAIQVAMSVAKELALAVIDKVLMPSESNLLSESIVILSKAVLKAGLGVGVNQVGFLLNQRLNLIDSNGLGGGNYFDVANNTEIVSNAMASTYGLGDATVEHFFTSVASKALTGALQKVGDKIADVFVDGTVGQGLDADFWREHVQWSDLMNLTIGPVFAEFVDRLKYDTMAAIRGSADYETSERPVGPNPTDPNAPTETFYHIKENDLSLGGIGTTSDDDSYLYRLNTTPNYGNKVLTEITGMVYDQTVGASLEAMWDAGPAELEAYLTQRRQAVGDGGDDDLAAGAPGKVKLDGPSKVMLQRWTQLRSAMRSNPTIDPNDVARLESLTLALLPGSLPRAPAVPVGATIKPVKLPPPPSGGRAAPVQLPAPPPPLSAAKAVGGPSAPPSSQVPQRPKPLPKPPPGPRPQAALAIAPPVVNGPAAASRRTAQRPANQGQQIPAPPPKKKTSA